MASEEELKQQLTELHKKRGGMKKRITAFEKYIESLNLDDLEGADEFNLRARLSSIISAFSSYELVQDEIDILTDHTEDEEQRKKVEDPYFSIIARAKHALNLFEGRQSALRDITSNASNAATGGTAQSQQ